MKYKVAELEGALLNAAVALAEGYTHLGAVGVNHRTDDGTPFCLSGCNDWWRSPDGKHMLCGPCQGYPRQYSEDWSEGGPIIDTARINVAAPEEGSPYTGWFAVKTKGRQIDAQAFGRTALIAAMRARVRSKFGDEVEL